MTNCCSEEANKDSLMTGNSINEGKLFYQLTNMYSFILISNFEDKIWKIFKFYDIIELMLFFFKFLVSLLISNKISSDSKC